MGYSKEVGRHVEIFDHTADVGLEARADTLGELLEALGEALADVVLDRRTVAPRETRRVRATAERLDWLVVDFLAEVMRAIQADRFAVASVRVTEASETAAVGELCGEPLDPARHELRTEIKAVTYHLLEARRDGDAWRARVILDV